LTWVLAFSCLSLLFGFIVSGLSWAGYTDCDFYYPDYDEGIYFDDGMHLIKFFPQMQMEGKSYLGQIATAGPSRNWL
jgi:hypothetical protein